MDEEDKIHVGKYVSLFILLGLALVLAWTVWPTRYRYTTSAFLDTQVTVRIDRFSGEAEWLLPGGWRTFRGESQTASSDERAENSTHITDPEKESPSFSISIDEHTQSGEAGTVTTWYESAVRVAPDKDSEVLVFVPEGTSLRVREKSEDFYLVKYKTHVGYLHKDLIEPEE